MSKNSQRDIKFRNYMFKKDQFCKIDDTNFPKIVNIAKKRIQNLNVH